MDYKVKKNNNATAEITIQFTAEELDAGFNQAYEKNKGKVKVPGFRPGKAPMDRIRKILGETVLEDAINITLNTAIVEVFPKLDPKPFRIPQFAITDEKFDRTKGFTAKATYDTYPEVTLPKYKKVKIDTYTVSPSTEEIQKELETIQQNQARNELQEEGTVIESGHLIEINYRMAPAGEELAEGTRTGKLKMDSPTNPPGFVENLLGVKIGETKEFTYTYPEVFPESPESAGKAFRYEIKVTAGYTVNLPPIDDDLASEFDGSESLEALKTKIRDRIVQTKSEELKNHSFVEIYNKLVEEGKFIIPESLVNDEAEFIYKTMFEQYRVPFVSMEEYSKQVGTSVEETRERFQKMGLKKLQGYFLRLKIAEEEKIQLTDTELQERLRELAVAFGETPEAFLKRMQKEDRISSIRENMLMEKIDQFVYDSVEKKSPKTVTVAEATQILGKENQTE